MSKQRHNEIQIFGILKESESRVSLETDHNRLKQLYAELNLENAALKDLLEKK